MKWNGWKQCMIATSCILLCIMSWAAIQWCSNEFLHTALYYRMHGWMLFRITTIWCHYEVDNMIFKFYHVPMSHCRTCWWITYHALSHSPGVNKWNIETKEMICMWSTQQRARVLVARSIDINSASFTPRSYRLHSYSK